MKLILLRGPSGTGKSTIARHLAGDKGKIHETDQFFSQGGVYTFVPTKIKEAHAWNQRQVEQSMRNKVPLVIVANTFIAHWEMKHYLQLAETYAYAVEMIRTPGPWYISDLQKRNEHSVPLNVLERQVSNYQSHVVDQVWSDMSIFK